MGRVHLAKAVLSSLRRKKEDSLKRKNQLIDYLKKLNQANINKKISGAKYVETLHKKSDGRNINEWVSYYENYSKNCDKEIYNQKKKIVRSKIPFFLFSVVFISALIYFAFSIGLSNINFTGFAVGDENKEFSDNLNLVFNTSTNYTWKLENEGKLESLRISGLIKGEGEVKIYLNDLLILDSSNIKVEKEKRQTYGLTGSVIDDSYSETETPSSENLNPSQEESLTENNISLQDEIYLENEVSLENKSELNNSYSETETPSLENLNPSQEESLTETNETNTTNVSIVTEERVIGPEEFTKYFEEACEETCNLKDLDLNSSSYTLRIEVNNAEISINEITYAILSEENIIEIEEINQTNISQSNFTNENITVKTMQYSAVLGQPVKWKKQITLNESGSAIVQLPKEAKNIVVNKIIDTYDSKKPSYSETETPSLENLNPSQEESLTETNKVKEEANAKIEKKIKEDVKEDKSKHSFGITGNAIDENIENISSEEIIEVTINDNSTEYEIEYETPAPYAIEEKFEKGKRVKIIGQEEIHYENVLAFTNLSEDLRIRDPYSIRIHWIENNTYIRINSIEDTDSNGIYDYIEWVVPHLSNQTFEIIIITNAEHLDSNRSFISDIFQEVSSLNNVWSETINDEEYVRVTFETNLTNANDITVYPRIISGNPRIEIYMEDGNESLGELNNLINNSYNKFYLVNLTGENDIFDLRIVGGSVEFDHIIDPPTCTNGICVEIFMTVGTATWTAPAGVVEVTAEVYGAGGPGADYDPYGGAGGGGGAYTMGIVNVTPGRNYSVIVGAEGEYTTGGLSNFTGDSSKTVKANGGSAATGRIGAAGGTAESVTGHIIKSNAGGTGGSCTPFGVLGGAGGGGAAGPDGIGNVGGDATDSVGGAGGGSGGGVAGSGGDGGYEGYGGNDGYEVGGGGGGAGGNGGWYRGMGRRGEIRLTYFQTPNITCYGIVCNVTFIGKGIWTVPTNVLNITVEAWGAGGGGAGKGTSNTYSGGGGGGGAHTKGMVNITSGISYNVTVGRGGYGGTNTLAGTAGGYSLFIGNSSATVKANGGLGSTNNAGAIGGAAESVTGYILASYAGGRGGQGLNVATRGGGGGGGGAGTTAGGTIGGNASSTAGAAGGAGGSLYGGTGGAGGNSGQVGYVGNTIAGGGGGAGSNNYRGGEGARGQIVITFLNDTSNPFFVSIPANASLIYGNQSLSVDFDASDAVGFGYFKVNDTRFSISSAGLLTNASPIGVGNYEINVSINDSFNKINWTRYKLQINKSSYFNCGVYFNTTSPLVYPNNFAVYTNCSSTYTIYRNGSSISNNSVINSGAGYYNLTVQRTDTANYTNTVHTQFFTITKNTENFNVLFNATSPLNYPDIFLVYANATSGFTLYKNGTAIGNNSVQINGAGYFNFTAQRTDTINYTYYFNSSFFTLNKNTENCRVLFNETSPLTPPNTFRAWANCTSAFVLTRNGTTITNNSEQVLSQGYYNFSMSRNDTSNYTIIFNQTGFTVSLPPNTPPEIVAVYNSTQMTDVSSGLNEGPLATYVRLNITAYDAQGFGNLNDSSVVVNFSKAGETARINSSCALLGDYGTYYANYTCNVTMWWWDAPGVWNINASIKDSEGNTGINATRNFSVGSTTGFLVNSSSVTWPSINPGSSNQEALSPMLLNNTGNTQVSVEINSTNLTGESNSAYALGANNFSVHTSAGCEGSSMAWYSYKTVVGAVVPRGNYSINDGTAQETIYFCLEQSNANLISQSYSTQQQGSWTIRVFLAVFAIRRRKKKGKTDSSQVPVTLFSTKLGALEAISKYMKENLNMSYSEIAKRLVRDERTIWTAYKKASKKYPEKIKIIYTEINLPLSIFENRKLTIFEAIVVYLKDKGMKYSEIGELLNRNQRNIWTIYSRSVKNLGGEKKISLEKQVLEIPATLFSTKLGALEAISKYMKENLGRDYGEIAELLNRDERTIWTAYKKANEKYKEDIKVDEGGISLPVSIFENRKLTIFEAIVVYLKDKGMKYSEIGELLNRNQRNIWTIYSRSVKNLE